MPIQYPASLDSLANPGSATLEDAPGFYHDEQHANANDAVEALQARVGISETVPQNTPLANTVLQSLADGRSKWAPIGAGLIAPGAAWVPLQTLSGVASSYQFTAIPQTYRALAWSLCGSGSNPSTTCSVGLRFNGDATAVYDDQWLYGTGATPATTERFAQTQILAGNLTGGSVGATQPGMIDGLIPNYAGTTYQKVCRQVYGVRYGVATGTLQAGSVAGFWRSVEAITSITLIATGGTFVAGSVATLWGVP